MKIGPKTVLTPCDILDINLAGHSGWQCLERMKKDDFYRDVPVVMYSTAKAASDSLLAKRLGAVEVLKKPHSFVDMTEILKNCLKKIGELC